MAEVVHSDNISAMLLISKKKTSHLLWYSREQLIFIGYLLMRHATGYQMIHINYI